MALKPWMFMGRIGDFETEGAKHILNRLEEGGIRDIVLGDLWFPGLGPTFAPNWELYRGVRTQPPEMSDELSGKAQMLVDAVKTAKDRGFGVYLHDWGQGAGAGCINDPEYTKYALARTRDTYEHYPEIDGFILDGPEYGYEIEPGHRSDVFRCFCPHCERKAQEWGYDFEAMRAAANRLKGYLRNLHREDVERFVEVPQGLFDPIDLAMTDPALFEWLRFKTESIQRLLGEIYRYVKGLDGRLLLGCGPRTAAFAPLTGYNFRRLTEVVDFICPKLYFWMHGVDGLKGTVYRYAKTLMEWNPGLTEVLALRLVFRVFGFTVPEVGTLEDLEKPLSPRFFAECVSSEISRSIRRAGNAEILRPWVGLHHGGIRLTVEELRQILQALERSGLKSLIYWHYGDMSDEEWAVLRSFCGDRWGRLS